MANQSQNRRDVLRQLRWPIRLTRMGMIAEQVLRNFWPMLSLILLGLAMLMLGAHEAMKLELVWGFFVVFVVGSLGSLIYGFRRFVWPTSEDAVDRLDSAMPARPIAAILDTQLVGSGDAASETVWRTHVERMHRAARNAKPVEPDLKIASRDPFALRYVALLAFFMAAIFGSFLRVATVADVLPLQGTVLANGPSWEGWIEPPGYTGKPALYLADLADDKISLPEGSEFTIRLYGQVGDLTVAETVSGRIGVVASGADPNQEFTATQSGNVSITGPGGKSWNIAIVPDSAPEIASVGEVERGINGEMQYTFSAKDDYAVVQGFAEISLDLVAVDRRYGLAIDPELRDIIQVTLPMPFTGSRAEFTETMVENLSQHPWANLPVKISLSALDAANNEGVGEAESIVLPGRRFFDVLAKSIVEQRRDLLWNRANNKRVSRVLRAITHAPDESLASEADYLKIRLAIRDIEAAPEIDGLSDDEVTELAQILWEIATAIEDGNLADALERLQQAQERLKDAIENGATDEEIAELMDELREAMQQYMQQLAEQSQQQPNEFSDNQEMMEMSGEQLQEMLDRLQELMEQGRMDEAEQLLDQISRMMENMQVTQGQGEQGEGQQALQGLSETLREQQGLSDETFGDLQEQGEGGGQQGQQGQTGPQGRGEGSQPGQQPGSGPGQSGEQGLADRQQSLRDQLSQQAEGLPGAGSPGGESAREALDRAGRAMERAEGALRDEDFAGALDRQSEAMEAMREGMRDMAEDMQQQQAQRGQQGDGLGQFGSDQSRDPLGRDAGATGRVGTDEQLLQGEDVYRRARELLDEIRKRSADQQRPEPEIDYLKRLLDRF